MMLLAIHCARQIKGRLMGNDSVTCGGRETWISATSKIIHKRHSAVSKH
jgi:hypothetical protein